ncbi:carbohydrate porin [Azohydromonas aeria]|uniref:carbohydrate porin n=1 Tax=Azohydromonas aeria TaxID=2590212 RepID=UPI0012F77916|nr:carbohydrate porin [Azohydromonas aeria]
MPYRPVPRAFLAVTSLLAAGGACAQAPAWPAAGASSPVAFRGDANVEIDTTHQNNGVGSTQGGRIELNLMGKTTLGDAFLAGKASFLARKDGGTATDDMWVQAGHAKADVKLGRFEAMDLYPQGRDTVLNRAGSGVYRANFIRGRFGGASGNVMHLAGHAQLADGLHLEVGLADTGKASNLAAGQAEGLRPVLSYAADGWLLKAGAEIGRMSDTGAGDGARFVDLRGVGLSASRAVGPGNLNVNVAAGKADGLWKSAVVAANYTVPLGPWVHLELGRIDPETPGRRGETVRTVGVGWQLSLFGIRDAYVTPALSWSSSSADAFQPGLGGTGQRIERAVRVRFNYVFAAF